MRRSEYMPECFTKSDGSMMWLVRYGHSSNRRFGYAAFDCADCNIYYPKGKRSAARLLFLAGFLCLKIMEAAIMVFGPLRNRVFGINQSTWQHQRSVVIADNQFFTMIAESVLS
jgi:hypothetical protein